MHALSVSDGKCSLEAPLALAWAIPLLGSGMKPGEKLHSHWEDMRNSTQTVTQAQDPTWSYKAVKIRSEPACHSKRWSF